MEEQNSMVRNNGEEKTKKVMFSRIAALVCAVFVLFSANKAVNGSLYKIPLISLAGEEAVDELKEECENLADQLENLSEEDEEEIKDHGLSVKQLEKFVKAPSLGMTLKILDATEEEIGGEDMIDLLKTVKNVIWIYGGIIALLMLMSALFENRALSIIGTVVSVPFHLALTGIVFLLIQIVLCVVHVVLVAQAKKLA